MFPLRMCPSGFTSPIESLRQLSNCTEMHNKHSTADLVLDFEKELEEVRLTPLFLLPISNSNFCSFICCVRACADRQRDAEQRPSRRRVACSKTSRSSTRFHYLVSKLVCSKTRLRIGTMNRLTELITGLITLPTESHQSRLLVEFLEHP